jgi:hypothetical protein
VVLKSHDLHWAVAQHVLRYLSAGYKVFCTCIPEGRTISDLWRCRFRRQSKLQFIVAKSITEAEFVAASTTENEIMWLRIVLKELKFEIKQTSSLFIDNQSAVQVAKSLLGGVAKI